MVDEDGIYTSRVLPGFWLREEWLWQTPLPHPLTVLGHIAGIDAQAISQFMELLKRTE